MINWPTPEKQLALADANDGRNMLLSGKKKCPSTGVRGENCSHPIIQTLSPALTWKFLFT